jgi:manganese/iron transport system permease protein
LCPLLVTPAATARLLTDRLGVMMALAPLLGGGSAVTGLYLSWSLEPGPAHRRGHCADGHRRLSAHLVLRSPARPGRTRPATPRDPGRGPQRRRRSAAPITATPSRMALGGIAA